MVILFFLLADFTNRRRKKDKKEQQRGKFPGFSIIMERKKRKRIRVEVFHEYTYTHTCGKKKGQNYQIGTREKKTTNKPLGLCKRITLKNLLQP